MFNEAAYQRFRNGAVDRVHGHVVPIIGAPSQGNFRQVPCSHDQPPSFIGQIHQNLRAFAGLDVFISGGSFGRIVPDVGKVPETAFRDGDFPEFHAQKAAHGHGIVMRSVRGAEAGHRYGQNVRGRPLQRPAGAGADEQSQRGVQPAGDADDEPLRAGMFHSFGQTCRLDGDDFLTPFPAAGRRRQKGPCRVESVFQAGRSGNLFRQGQMQGIPGREKGFAVIEGAFREARRLQPFKIHVRKDEGAFPAEPFPLRCWPAVVRNEGMAAEYGVRGGFMHTCGGKDIGTEASAALLSDQFPPVCGLTGEFRSCGRVENGSGSQKSQLGTGGNDAPQVFAYFHAKTEGGRFFMKNDFRPERDMHPIDCDFLHPCTQFPAGGELTFFIEFPVVGEHGFGHQSQNAAGLHYRRRIIQSVFMKEGQAHHGNRAGAFRGFRKAEQAVQGCFPQVRLEEKVSAGIARNAQFRENDGCRLLFCGFPEFLRKLVDIVVHFSHAKLGDGGGESVISEHGRSSLKNGTRRCSFFR